MASITQDMRYRLSLIMYADKYGVTKAAIKCKTNSQYIYRWRFVETFEEHSSYSSAHFLEHLIRIFSIPSSVSKLTMGRNLRNALALMAVPINLPPFRCVLRSLALHTN